MAEQRRTHAQRKYAQGMSAPPSLAGPVFMSTRLAASTNSSPNISQRDQTPTRTGMNVQELMDHISSRGLRQADPVPLVKEIKVEDMRPVKDTDRKKTASVVRIPIVKLSNVTNSIKAKHIVKNGIHPCQLSAPIAHKGRPNRSRTANRKRSAEQPLTRSKSTSITTKSLRSRSITSPVKPAKIAKKTSIPPLRNNTMKSLRQRVITKNSTTRPTQSPKKPQLVKGTAVPRPKRIVTIAKRPRRSVRSSPSPYSSDDETPLKFIPKNRNTNTATYKPNHTESTTSSSSSEPSQPTIKIATAGHKKAPNIADVIEEAPLQPEMQQVKESKPESFPEQSNENSDRDTHSDSTLQPGTYPNIDQTIYDFQEEPPITMFTRKNESSSHLTTTNDHYIIYGPANKLRCKLNKEKIAGLPPSNPVISSTVLHSTSAAVPSVVLPATTVMVPSAVLPSASAVVPLAERLSTNGVLPAAKLSMTCAVAPSAILPLASAAVSPATISPQFPSNSSDLDYDSDPTIVGVNNNSRAPVDYGVLSDSSSGSASDNGAAFPEPAIKGKDRIHCSYKAPVFSPTAADFKDPLAFIQQITPMASKWGICKIIPPATEADITPNLPEEVKFNCLNQYLNRMYMRWGPATRELCAIKTNLTRNGIKFDRPPLIDGVEVNLPAFYSAVQRRGGFKEVLEKAKLEEIAEELKLRREGRRLASQMDKIYCRYLVPYDALSDDDRQTLLDTVEREWARKFKQAVARASRPTHRQRRPLRASASSDSDDERPPGALGECEECVTRGRAMSLAYFRNLAGVVRQMYFPGQRTPKTEDVERDFWKHVLQRSQHACVYAAAIDSGEAGLGFPRPGPDQPAWNLKVVSDSAGSVLRSLGPVMGLTVPTIHLGMLFSTSCWHRDPHGLPWIEYHHSGAPKIWYGIPDQQSENFKQAVAKLAPSFCLNKTIWLPSDVLMLPPSLLSENGVSLARAVQSPGEIVVVFPKAYTSSVCTGYSVSESVYFGPEDWLATVREDFKEVRESCEPTMFPLEQLLLAIARDPRATKPVLLQAYAALKALVDDERADRRRLAHMRVKMVLKPVPTRLRADQEECDVCRSSLYLSKVSGISDAQVCLKHAIAIGKVKPPSLARAELTIRFTDLELSKALDKMEGRIFGQC